MMQKHQVMDQEKRLRYLEREKRMKNLVMKEISDNQDQNETKTKDKVKKVI